MGMMRGCSSTASKESIRCRGHEIQIKPTSSDLVYTISIWTSFVEVKVSEEEVMKLASRGLIISVTTLCTKFLILVTNFFKCSVADELYNSLV